MHLIFTTLLSLRSGCRTGLNERVVSAATFSSFPPSAEELHASVELTRCVGYLCFVATASLLFAVFVIVVWRVLCCLFGIVVGLCVLGAGCVCVCVVVVVLVRVLVTAAAAVVLLVVICMFLVLGYLFLPPFSPTSFFLPPWCAS